MKPLYFPLLIAFPAIHCSAQETSADTVYTNVNVHAEYRGGEYAFLHYLDLHLHYPFDARHNDIQGTVVVQFVVGKDGKLSDIQATSGPTEGGLREEAVRLIRRSGKWKPAIANGQKVKSILHQPIFFTLQ
jgi:periplasmic protein TonB